jgi:hypothetical protein
MTTLHPIISCASSEKMKINLDLWQQNFINTEGNKILCTGRQVGKSVICSIDAGEYATKNANKTILMIAPTERQAYALFEKTLNYLAENYPAKLAKGKEKPTKTKIQLKNQTQIWCLPTGISGLGIRFLTVHRLYVDEASRVPEDVWTAVTPMMLTTGGATILLSTPAGKSGYFYDVWKNRDNSFENYTRFGIDSEKVINERVVCPTWTQLQKEKALEYLKQEKTRMSLLQYSQEYCGEFVDELRQFFPTELIKKCLILKREEFFRKNQNDPTFLGVDVARMGGDETVLLSIISRCDQTILTQFDLDISTHTRLTETTEKILNADIKYDYEKILIDDGGLGVGVFDALLNDEQTKRKVIAINNSSRSLDNEGKRKKKLLKEDLYNNLLTLMEQGKIQLFENDEMFHSLKSIQAEWDKEQLHIFGTNTHITEALIRAAWGFKTKKLNIWIDFN